MIKTFPAGKGGWGSWAFASSLADSQEGCSQWSLCPEGKAALCQARFEPVSKGTSLCRGVSRLSYWVPIIHISKAQADREAEALKITKLFSNLVNNFDTTHITAAEKHSVPLQIAFYQRAACGYRWENHWSKACRRLQPRLCAFRENAGEEENFWEQRGSSWPQRNDLFILLHFLQLSHSVCGTSAFLSGHHKSPKKFLKVSSGHLAASLKIHLISLHWVIWHLMYHMKE